jgi:hypothetical protein
MIAQDIQNLVVYRSDLDISLNQIDSFIEIFYNQLISYLDG